MTRDEVIKLLQKEREYEKQIFGEYIEAKSLNPASFLIFIEKYVGNATTAYQGPWTLKKLFPAWLKECYESSHEYEDTAPVAFYENVIKIAALCMALLETYAEIDPEKWREDPEKDSQKWQLNQSEKE